MFASNLFPAARSSCREDSTSPSISTTCLMEFVLWAGMTATVEVEPPRGRPPPHRGLGAASRRSPPARSNWASSTARASPSLLARKPESTAAKDSSPVIADLAIAHGDARYARLLRSLARVKLLILDDWGRRRSRPTRRAIWWRSSRFVTTRATSRGSRHEVRLHCEATRKSWEATAPLNGPATSMFGEDYSPYR